MPANSPGVKLEGDKPADGENADGVAEVAVYEMCSKVTEPTPSNTNVSAADTSIPGSYAMTIKDIFAFKNPGLPATLLDESADAKILCGHTSGQPVDSFYEGMGVLRFDLKKTAFLYTLFRNLMK